MRVRTSDFGFRTSDFRLGPTPQNVSISGLPAPPPSTVSPVRNQSHSAVHRFSVALSDTVPTIVNEDGSIEKWSIDGDIEKVKKDLDADIVGLNELIITFQSAIDEDWEIIKEKYNEIFND